MRALLLTLVIALPGFGATPGVEILWDKYGVPHIYAADRESMFYANGWAQMHNQADLLLRLYGESRGRAAEYWGPAYLELDRWVQLNGVPERAQEWYAAQDPRFRTYLDAFAAGINDFAKAHPDAISPQWRVVLPVSGVDVVGHSLRAVHYMYMGSQERMQREVDQLVKSRSAKQQTAQNMRAIPQIDAQSNLSAAQDIPGSNTWAIGPPRSASGKAMLIINPHLMWGETFYRYMEMHLVGPGYDLYGAPQIGFPTPVVGFNPRTGWGRTVNTIDTVDFYELTVRDGKYEFDGELRPFETQRKVIKVKQPDGSFKEEKLEIRRSVHGPVVFSDKGITVAMRVAGLDRPKMLEQWFRMGEARNLDEFKAALRMMAVPMWNANYADVNGHIMLVYDGLVPKRKFGDVAYWSKVVPGNTSETLWTEYLSFDELPKSVDPPSGFNQNTNEPPWSMTLPELDASKFPAYLSPAFALSFRTKRSLRMLTEESAFTYEKLLADKHSTHMEMADALLPDLLKAAEGSVNPRVRDAATVLSRWDRETETYSRGAVLFQMFADRYFRASNFNDKLRVKFDGKDPLNTGYGIGDIAAALMALEEAAIDCAAAYGSLDVPWGQVYRFASGGSDLPGNGADGVMGVFRTIRYGRPEGKQNYATHGETFVCAIEFGEPQRAECALSYGNSSQHGSIHQEDQLPLMVEKRLHPIWRDRKEVEAHLEQREVF
jgi:acyl-homoserine-lactone acylase